MNDFYNDDAWQCDIRDRILVPQFYQKRCNGRYVLMDKGRLATFMQRRMAVDTIAQLKGGEAASVEEKIVRWPKSGRAYTAFCLETESCTVPGHKSSGWMVYGEADYLLYCFHQKDDSLDCHLIDFQRLKEWFWPDEETWPVFQMPTQNRTRGRLVPISRVDASVPCWRFALSEARAAA